MTSVRGRLGTLDTYVLVALGGVVVTAVFDPSGGLVPHVKYALAFAFAGVALIAGMRGRLESLREYDVRLLFGYLLAFSFVLPGYAIAIHFLRGDYQGGPWTIYLGSNLFLVLVALGATLSGSRLNLERILIAALTMLSVLIWALPVLDLGFGLDPFYFGFKHDIYSYQFRTYGPLSLPYVYYYTSPMLVFAVAYWGRRTVAAVSKGEARRWFPVSMFLLVDSALFMSGTRANIVASVLLAGWLIGCLNRRALLALLAVGVVAIGAGWRILAPLVSTSGGSTADSNAIKIDYLQAYGNLFSDPVGLIFGYGLGSCVESSRLAECLPVVELTYIDLIRVFGVLGAIAYLLLLLLPVFRNRSRYLAVGWTAYLGLAILNPYIFSTNGMLVLAPALLGATVLKITSERPRMAVPWLFSGPAG